MKPAQLALLALIHICHPIVPAPARPPPSPVFRSLILQLVLREALDPYEDLSLKDLTDEVLSFGSREEAETVVRDVLEVLSLLQSTSNIHDFLRSVHSLLNPLEEDMSAATYIIERRSPLGQYIRRLFLAYQKTSFEGVAKLQARLHKWCAPLSGEEIEENEDLEVRPLDETQETRSKAFESYRAALSSGDYTKTLSSLQQFFAYQFPRQDRGLHQHALLNMANFHLQEGEYPACRRSLDEAIKIARSAGDKSCLESCMSVLRRLDYSQPYADPPELSEQEITMLSPLDQLWELKRRLASGEPVRKSWHRLYVAIGKQESALVPSQATSAVAAESGETQQTRHAEVDEGTLHAIQAGLWGTMGEDLLAEHREDLALSSPSLDMASRLAVLQSRAMRMARKGSYTDALSLLFLPTSVASLTLKQYHSWATTVWDILTLQARRKEQADVLAYIETLRGDAKPGERREGGHPVMMERKPEAEEGWDDELEEEITGATRVEKDLEKGKRMLTARQPASAMPSVLSAMETSSNLGLYGLHRLTVIMLADVSIDMNMPEYASELVDEAYGQIIISQDEELKAYAALTKARALVCQSATFPDRRPLLLEALPHLRAASTSYALVSLYAPRLHALQLEATVLDSLGRTQERDTVADEWDHLRIEWGSVKDGEGMEASLREVKMVAEGVMEVGVGISLGRV